MIHHVSKYTNKERNTYNYYVFYESGRKVRYSASDNLPNTVINWILNGTCETMYTSTGKIERFY